MSHVDEGTLHAYLDGELPPDERSGLETHVAQCATCKERLAEERALFERASALLGSARPVERPAPPFEQVRRSPRRARFPLTSVAWAASIMLAVGLGYYLRDAGYNPASTQSAPQPVEGVARLYDTGAHQEAERVTVADESDRAVASTQERRQPRRQSVARAEETADANKPRADSTVAGVVALEPSMRLRNATPAPAAAAAVPNRDSAALRLDAAVVMSEAKAQSGVVAVRGRAVTTQWQIISRSAATTLLGTNPVGLPGLATRRIRRSPAPDVTVVVEQALDSATVIQIFQQSMTEEGYADRGSREAAPPAAARAATPADRLARFVGRLRVEISGPLTTDSLNKLLDQVEPLP